MIKNKMALGLTLSCYMLLFSCQDKSVTVESEKEAVKQTLISMWDAIENEDINAYASLIHPDFTQFGEYDSILRVGKIAEVAGIKSWIETSENIQTKMHDPIVTINGNVAWIVYYWSDQGSTDGVDFSTRGKSTRIFIKENGSWLCVHGHYTLLP
jgi:ketosteroid isomerase-like protein